MTARRGGEEGSMLTDVSDSLVTIESVRNALVKSASLHAALEPPAASSPPSAAMTTPSHRATNGSRAPKFALRPSLVDGEMILAASGHYQRKAKQTAMRMWMLACTARLYELRLRTKATTARKLRAFLVWFSVSLEWQRAELAGWEWSRATRASISSMARTVDGEIRCGGCEMEERTRNIGGTDCARRLPPKRRVAAAEEPDIDSGSHKRSERASASNGRCGENSMGLLV